MNSYTVEHFENKRVTIFTLGKPYDFANLFCVLSPACIELLKEITQIAAPYTPSKIAVPHTHTFNAAVRPHQQFTSTVTCNGISFALNEHHTDGVALAHHGDAALIVTGDCPTVILWDQHDATTPIIAAHAGRDSLHNLNNHHFADVESVIDTCISYFSDPACVHARIVASIAPEHFRHDPNPGYETRSERLLTHFRTRYPTAVMHETCIDLPTLITEQLVSHGVASEHITHDGHDSYSDPRLWSHRAGDRQRNGILVIRN